MTYFFILGSNPTLSLAELAAVFTNGKFFLPQKNIAILETDQELKSDILKTIGGTIKFGLISNELTSHETKAVLSAILKSAPAKTNGKFYFGISYYGKTKLNVKVLGMEFKKLLKQNNISSRWVVSKEATLSSVVVEQNKLTTDRGREIVIIQDGKKLLVGKTLAVQPFKQLSFRDYGRPSRDDYSGMLPPKLAQIMINLSGAKPDDTILDPFCGSGTILTEAALLGYQNLIGADISPKAVQSTKNNFNWIKNNFQLSITNYELINTNAIEISKHLAPNSIDAIITEPYLGPQRGKLEIEKTKNELEQLYSRALNEFDKILKPGSRIVMVWPVFQGKSGSIFINPKLNGFKIINPLPDYLQTNSFINLTSRQTIIYGREKQKVWREIVELQK